jgi:hypothetical protein
MATSSYPSWTQLTGSVTAPVGTAYMSVEAVGFDVGDPLIGVYLDDVAVNPSTSQITMDEGSFVLTKGGAPRFTIDSDASDFEQLTFPSGNGSEIQPSRMGGGVINGGTTLATTLTSPTDDPSGSPDWTVLTLEKDIGGDSRGTFTADRLELGAQIGIQNGGDVGFIADDGGYQPALFQDSYDADTPYFGIQSPFGDGGDFSLASILINGSSSTSFTSILMDAEVTEIFGQLYRDLYPGAIVDPGIGNVTQASTAGAPYGGQIGIDRTGASNFSIAGTGATATTYNEVSFAGVERPNRQYVFKGKFRFFQSGATSASLVQVNVRTTTPGTGTVVATFNIPVNIGTLSNGADYYFEIPYRPNPGSEATGLTNYFVDLKQVVATSGSCVINVQRNLSTNQNFIAMIDIGEYTV